MTKPDRYNEFYATANEVARECKANLKGVVVHVTFTRDQGYSYLIEGPTGMHALLCEVTPVERLRAHVKGFVFNA